MARTARVEWDDLRYVLAVADHGSLAAAARALGVNHTTVLRRVNAFEATQGLRLFERLPTGYALTAGGEELLAAARQMDGVVADLERRLAGQDLRLEGALRVTTTDTLMDRLVPGILAGFRVAHPGITVEVSVSNQVANLSRRDADVAIRPAAGPPETLVGRRVSRLAFAIYAAPGRVGQLRAAPEWIGADDSLATTTAARWMRSRVDPAAVAARTDSYLAMRNLAIAGLGLAALPCYLGDSSPLLVRTEPDPLSAVAIELWVLTHEDLRNTARVRAFTEFACAALARQRDLIEGRQPQP